MQKQGTNFVTRPITRPNKIVSDIFLLAILERVHHIT